MSKKKIAATMTAVMMMNAFGNAGIVLANELDQDNAVVATEVTESEEVTQETTSEQETTEDTKVETEEPVEPEVPTEEKPGETEEPAEEKPTEEKPVEEKPVEEKPVEEKPVEQKPTEEKPVEVAPPTTTQEAKPKQPEVVEVPKEVQEVKVEQALPTNDYTSGIIEDGSMKFSKDTTAEAFIAKIAGGAVKVAEENDLYASVMIAQALLESGNGQSLLAKEPNRNLFGIKGSHNGKSVVMATQEDKGTGEMYTIRDGFRVYDTYEESFEDYAKLLKEGISGNPDIYKGAWKSEAKDYKEATKYLTGKYATDTKYNQKLNGIIETYNLDRLDELDKVLAVAVTQEGKEYNFGGKTPESSFDCSGLVSWAYKEAYDIEVAAYTETMYADTYEVDIKEAQPGDLIFFKGTYGAPNFISHVEMYVSEGMMYGSNSSGIGFHDYTDAYWQSHFDSVRRVVK